ncbi:peptide chain release factor N(5)-glutamine methyltransferase [Mycoplasma crocodyli]|uniref:peptide chain release factor N(5)-glutamine methyltransferase n=1 Tax=Mycoplasma crocodyli (strain ATCC 51981 / MP145) TaxID=512564 RepID=D5E605_MYCCM|nr:peptide chain release factor N(5)-glutamine methyltransferase [Mycoplasma crocodyli]ADE19874.1 bifunctional methyltransferase [Mycoplasma crocodyli MP145]
MSSISELLKEKRKYGLKQTINQEEINQISKQVPVQKIIGYIEYANVKINIQKNVLIPRYETEELIFLALKNIKNDSKVLDLCCGSGFIGIALKFNNKNLQVTLSDIDDNAIEQSKINTLENNVKVKIIKSDLFENIDEKFDCIISNPPYLMKSENISNNVLNHEPHHALFADDNGLFFYKEIMKQSKKYLNKNGKLIFEINPLHHDFWIQIVKNNDAKIYKDISGLERFVIINHNNEIKIQ